MKTKSIIVTISLNILFCTVLLWFFSRNAFLRPYLGSLSKEVLSGLLLLTTFMPTISSYIQNCIGATHLCIGLQLSWPV